MPEDGTHFAEEFENLGAKAKELGVGIEMEVQVGHPS